MKIKKKYRLHRIPSKKEDMKCIACNGSGHYDHDGSPKCSSCNGTGVNQNEYLNIRG